MLLPLPFLEPEPWQYDAKCAEQTYDPVKKEYTAIYNADLWFPPRDKKLYKPIADKAKAICYGKDGRPECPVRMQCLLYADRTEEAHGIWGGMSHRERNALKRKAVKMGTTLEALAKKGK